MQDLPEKLKDKLAKRAAENSLRSLKSTTGLIDFTSNDYLGFADSKLLSDRAREILKDYKLPLNGSTGSRLLRGNNPLFEHLESVIALHHDAPAALIFNSGFDANIGMLSSLPQRRDLIVFDELVHASIREGIRLSVADSVKFRHNDLSDLDSKLEKLSDRDVIYVVTESVFSMDGHSPDLKSLCELCEKYNCRLIVDEAHALGISSVGLVSDLELQKKVFARVVTFGKALGCHGSAVLANSDVVMYLMNFTRSFIYTTAMPPHNLASVIAAYELIGSDFGKRQIEKLKSNIAIIRSKYTQAGLSHRFIESESAIQSYLVKGNKAARELGASLVENGIDVRPILPPTVPEGEERLRICIHSFNTIVEIDKLISHLKDYNE